VETLDDGAVGVPLLSRADAAAIVADTALDDLLAGVRGGDPLDRDALVELVRRVGDLAATAPVAELDLNPVVVGPEGVAVVDALVRTEREED
jgi:acetyltransferase